MFLSSHRLTEGAQSLQGQHFKGQLIHTHAESKKLEVEELR